MELMRCCCRSSLNAEKKGWFTLNTRPRLRSLHFRQTQMPSLFFPAHHLHHGPSLIQPTPAAVKGFIRHELTSPGLNLWDFASTSRQPSIALSSSPNSSSRFLSSFKHFHQAQRDAPPLRDALTRRSLDDHRPATVRCLSLSPSPSISNSPAKKDAHILLYLSSELEYESSDLVDNPPTTCCQIVCRGRSKSRPFVIGEDRF